MCGGVHMYMVCEGRVQLQVLACEVETETMGIMMHVMVCLQACAHGHVGEDVMI